MIEKRIITWCFGILSVWMGVCCPIAGAGEKPDWRQSSIYDAWIQQWQQSDGSEIADYYELEAAHRAIAKRVSRIAMLRSGCEKPCGSITVVFDDDGTVSLIGHDSVTGPGKREGKIPSHRFEQMACGSITVVFDADGTVSLIGHDSVTGPGKREGKIPSHRFEQMARFVVELGFSGLRLRYASNVTDTQATFFLAVIDEQQKVVMNYAESGPAGLWALEKVIDDLLLQVDWSQEDRPN